MILVWNELIKNIQFRTVKIVWKDANQKTAMPLPAVF